MIVIVAVVIVIASAVFVYITQYYNPNSSSSNNELTVEGTVLSVVDSGEMYGNFTVYNITLDDGNSYLMLFRNSTVAVVPPVGVTLRFYYSFVGSYYDIYRVKSLG